LSPGRIKFPTVPIGSVAYGSFGTSTTPVAGTWWIADVLTTRQLQATGMGVLNAATVGTNKWIVALYDAQGNLLANSATAGVVTAGANAFQEVPFTSSPNLPAGSYFLAAQLDGTTDRFRTVATLTFIDVVATSN